MLSKMFPKAGQTVPEIRLDGFEGEWEINKLNKYLTVSKQKNTQLKFDKEDVLSVSGEFWNYQSNTISRTIFCRCICRDVFDC